MSMFMQTMTKAIIDYRQILRRYLPAKERTSKVKQLRLKDPAIFKSEVMLYQVGQGIIEDIQNNIQVPDEGYYSYHGITKFCQYLQSYLLNYETNGHEVLHKAQKAANAMIKVIQIIALPYESLSDEIANELKQCSVVVATCGSKDQRRIYHNALQRQSQDAPGFYGEILQHYEQCGNSSNKK